MNEDLLSRIGGFGFHLDQLPEEMIYSDIQEVGVTLVITVGVEILQNSLLDWGHSLLELLSEALRLHSEGVEIREGLAAHAGE